MERLYRFFGGVRRLAGRVVRPIFIVLFGLSLAVNFWMTAKLQSNDFVEWYGFGRIHFKSGETMLTEVFRSSHPLFAHEKLYACSQVVDGGYEGPKVSFAGLAADKDDPKIVLEPREVGRR